jgi:hypothetical protein
MLSFQSIVPSQPELTFEKISFWSLLYYWISIRFCCLTLRWKLIYLPRCCHRIGEHCLGDVACLQVLFLIIWPQGILGTYALRF